jgi:hypothetical protein
MSRYLVALFAVTLAGQAFAQPPKARPAVVDAAYVPPKFVAALVVNPARLEKSAAGAGFPVADLLKLVEDQTGIDPKVIDRAVLYIDPMPGGNVAFFPAAAVRFKQGTDAKKQLAAALGETTEATASDKTYLRSAKVQMAKAAIAGYAIDDRTAIFAPWPKLEEMLKGGKEDRPLAVELEKADLDHDLVLVVVPKPIHQLLDVGLSSAPPSLAPTLRALKPVEAATVTADFDKDPVIRAAFRADNADGAEVVHKEVKRVLDWASQDWPADRKEIEKELPGWAKPLLPLLDETLKNPKVAKDGKTVTLTVARPKDWPAQPRK